MIGMYYICDCLSVAIIGESHVMGWGSKAIEIRAVENGQLDGVFMHKRTQKLRFLCERNDKVKHIHTHKLICIHVYTIIHTYTYITDIHVYGTVIDR